MRIKLRRWASPILTGGCQIHPGLDPDDLKRVVVLKWSVRWISEGLYTHVNIVFDGFVSWGWPHIDQRPRWTWPVVPSNSHLFYGTLSFIQLQISRKLISSYIAAIMVCVCVWSLRCKACACSGSGPSLFTLYGPVQLRHASMRTLLRLLVAVVCVLCHPHCGLNMTAFQIKTTVKYYNKCLYNIRFNY